MQEMRHKEVTSYSCEGPGLDLNLHHLTSELMLLTTCVIGIYENENMYLFLKIYDAFHFLSYWVHIG